MEDRQHPKQSDDGRDEDLDRSKAGRKNREQMDDTPPPGTDPLHEGP